MMDTKETSNAKRPAADTADEEDLRKGKKKRGKVGIITYFVVSLVL